MVELRNSIVRVGRPALAAVFKIEIVIIVIIGLVLLSLWAKQYKDDLYNGSDRTVCLFLDTC